MQFYLVVDIFYKLSKNQHSFILELQFMRSTHFVHSLFSDLTEGDKRRRRKRRGNLSSVPTISDVLGNSSQQIDNVEVLPDMDEDL